MWVFLWETVHTSTGWLVGARDQQSLLPVLKSMGVKIKNKVLQ